MDSNVDKFILNEQKLIHLLLNHTKAIDDIGENNITPDLFSDRHKFIVECILNEYLDKSSSIAKTLSRNAFEFRLKNHFGKTGDVLTQLKIYDICTLKAFAALEDIGVLKTELLNGFASRQSNKALNNYKNNLDKSGAFSAVKQLSDELSSINVKGNCRQNVFATLGQLKSEYIKEKQEQIANPAKIITTGINEFDKTLIGGLEPQTLTLIVADSGHGKTTTMLSIGINVAKKKEKVLFVSLEMPRRRLIDKIVANIGSIDLNLIYQPHTMNEDQKKSFFEAIEKWETLSDDFAILDSVDRVSVSMLRREIELRAMVFNPRVVIVDYVGVVKPEARYKDRNDLELGEITKDLRFLGKKYDFATISAAQLNRDAIRRMRKSKEAVAGGEDLRGSGELTNDSDFIFALFPSDIDGILRGQTVKSRYGKINPSFELLFEGQYSRVGNKCSANIVNANLDDDFGGTCISKKIVTNDLDDLDFSVG